MVPGVGAAWPSLAGSKTVAVGPRLVREMTARQHCPVRNGPPRRLCHSEGIAVIEPDTNPARPSEFATVNGPATGVELLRVPSATKCDAVCEPVPS